MTIRDSRHQLGDAPVDPRSEDLLRALGRGLDEMLNPNPDEKEWAFVVILTRFDETEGRANYLSNASRDDVVVMLREQLARFEGQAEPPTGHA